MNNMAANLVAQRGNRCTATILGYLEEHVYEQHDIPERVQMQVRKVVLDSINQFKDLTIDIVKSGDSMVNDFWLENLDKIHDAIVGLKEDLYYDETE